MRVRFLSPCLVVVKKFLKKFRFLIYFLDFWKKSANWLKIAKIGRIWQPCLIHKIFGNGIGGGLIVSTLIWKEKVIIFFKLYAETKNMGLFGNCKFDWAVVVLGDWEPCYFVKKKLIVFSIEKIGSNMPLKISKVSRGNLRLNSKRKWKILRLRQ